MLSRAKRVVVLSTDPWLDKLHGTSILGLLEVLTSSRYKVKVFLPSATNKIIEHRFFSVTGLGVKRYIPILTLISLYKRVLRLLFKEKSSVVIFDFAMLPLFFFVDVLWKSKGIMLILSRPVHEQGILGWLHFVHFRLALMLGKPFVSTFTAISPFEATEYSRLGKIPKHKTMIVPSPLGEVFEKFDQSIDENEFRVKLGFDALLGKNVILYQGVLDEQRGILEFLELFTKSFKDDDRITLLLVGDGPAKHSIRKFMQRTGIKNIVFWGPVPYSKMPEVIAACDVGLVLLPDNPRWRYQCPTKLIEFLVLGKPVIASDLPGIRWICANSPRVTYLRQLDSYGFRKALINLICDPNEIAVHAIQARQEMISRFSSKSIALELGRMIDSL